MKVFLFISVTRGLAQLSCTVMCALVGLLFIAPDTVGARLIPTLSDYNYRLKSFHRRAVVYQFIHFKCCLVYVLSWLPSFNARFTLSAS